MPVSRMAVLGLGLLCLLGVSVGARAAEAFEVRLTMVPIEVATRAAVTGSGSATAVLDGRRLTVKGTFAGMRGAATIAQIHQGVLTGVRGPALYDLTVAKAADGALSGQVELTPAQVESLRQGRLYIQIHSVSAPDGNLWGWLLR
jgi:CHRD domain